MLDAGRLLALEEAQRLKSRYCRVLDAKDWDGWWSLFADDARFLTESAPEGEGKDWFLDHLQSHLGGAVTSHQVHMPLLEASDAEHVRGIWAMHDYDEYAGGPPRDVKHGFGHYHEAYRRDPDGWKITELELTRIRQDVQPDPYGFAVVGEIPRHGPEGARPLTVEQLVDLEEIKQVKARYFRFLDTKRWDDWRALFADDARLTVPGRTAGSLPIDEFFPVITKAHAATVTVHQGHTPDVVFTGPDEARCIWSLNDFCDRPAGRMPSNLGYGYYDETYRRVDGAWRIASLALSYARRDDLPDGPVVSDPVPARLSDDWLPAGGLPDAERLADLEAIRRLKARYFLRLDRKDWDAYRDLFTDDLKAEGTKSTGQGRDDFVAGVAAVLAGRTTVHQGHMPEIRFLDEDRARGIWALYDYVEADGGPEREGFEGYGHYEEEYRRVDGDWKIAHLRLTRLRRDPLAGDPLPAWAGRRHQPTGIG
jgi:uncharacterized protein (TIGR02246 family)